MQIRRGTHRGRQALEHPIRAYRKVYNGNAKPFIWTRNADQILKSLNNYCTVVSDTGHWFIRLKPCDKIHNGGLTLCVDQYFKPLKRLIC